MKAPFALEAGAAFNRTCFRRARPEQSRSPCAIKPNYEFAVTAGGGSDKRSLTGRGGVVMLRKLVLSIALAAGFAIPLAGSAEAAIGDGALGLSSAVGQLAPIQKVQFVFGGQNYCWYDNGWQGPGFYWCGYAWNTGVGWGGGYGWNGWHGGYGVHGYGWNGGGVYHGGGYGYHGGGVYHGGGGFHGGGVYHGGGFHGGGFHGGGAHFHGGGGGHYHH
jgi:hypothetical protein